MSKLSDLSQEAYSGEEDRQSGLRIVHRTIVSAYILSQDNLLLMGRQDPAKGGTSPGALRIPGGGKKPGETLVQAMVREGNDEAPGLELREDQLTLLPLIAEGASGKTLSSGERVWQKMVLYHFAARLDGRATDYDLRPSSELVELGWYDEQQRSAAEKVPLGEAMMLKAGVI